MDGVHNSNRIIFVEPNNIDTITITEDGKKKVIPLMPRVEDYCVSFELRASVQNRFKSAINNSISNSLTLSWFTRVNKDGVDDTFSFLSGKEMDNKRYLTTYYTDISFENYGTQNIVEGLGVESIQVSFESWYTPTVQIKFVDVRGSSIWGNEEAIHNQMTRLTAQNVFGCFFTIPYPKFQLQIKGFLGNPVTYQLTCSNFNGSYNSQTGNFEATASFIGYTYGLLTDIPFEYLMAAPYSDYFGSAYWDKRVNSNEWALSDGRPPIKFQELFEKIKAGNEYNPETGYRDKEDIARQEEINQNLDKYETLKNAYDDLINVFTNLKWEHFNYWKVTRHSKNNNDYIDGFLSNKYTVDEYIDRLTKRGYKVETQANPEHIVELLYNISNPSYVKAKTTTYSYTELLEKAENDDLLDKNGVQWSVKCNIFKPLVDAVNNVNSAIDSYNESSEESEKIDENKKVKIGTRKEGTIWLPYKEAKDMDTLSIPLDIPIRFYHWRINLNDVYQSIQDKVRSDTKENNEIEQRFEQADEKASDIASIIGFTPYIGDVIKIVMCHFETFIQMVFHAAQTIYDQGKRGRSPAHLKVNINKTDVLNADALPPFPGLFDNGTKGKSSGETNDSENYYAWCGNFSHNFEEENLVIGLMHGMEKYRTDEIKEIPDANSSYKFFPITPYDILDFQSPFEHCVDYCNISCLSGYLSFRAFYIFGVINDESISDDMINLIGKMDAYNYYTSVASASTIKSEIFDKLGEESLYRVLMGIAQCKESYDNFGLSYGNSQPTQAFETYEIDEEFKKYGDRKRHPIFLPKDDYYEYVHYYDSRYNSLIPTKLGNYNDYKNDFIFTSEAEEKDKDGKVTKNKKIYYKSQVIAINDDDVHPYFKTDYNYDEYKEVVAHAWAISCNSQCLIDSDSTGTLENYLWNYKNESTFTIITESSIVESMQDIYKEVKNGKLTIIDYATTEDFTSFVNQYWKLDNSDFARFYKNNIPFLYKNADLSHLDDDYLLPLKDSKKEPTTLLDDRSICTKNVVVYDAANSCIKDDGNVFPNDSITVRSFNIYDNNTKHYDSLFLHELYYAQNQNTDYACSVRAKAYLFLHSIPFSYENVLQVFNARKSHGTYEIVPYGMILFLGALLWRQRWMDETKSDPIIYDAIINKYKPCAYNETLLVKRDDGNYYFTGLSATDKRDWYVTLNQIFGYSSISKNAVDIDRNIENQLILEFEKFVSDTFVDIMNFCELKSKDGKSLSASDFHKNWLIWKSCYDDSYTTSFKLELLNSLFGNWKGRYRVLFPSSNGNISIFAEEKWIQDTFTILYSGKVIIADGSCRKLSGHKNYDDTKENNKGVVKVRKKIINQYFESFCQKLKEVVDNSSDTEEVPEDVQKDIDIRTNIYFYLKNLWDKWLLHINDANYYNVENYFAKNFVFIDSFYKNTYSSLPINAQKLIDVYDGIGNNGSMFSYINNVISEHNCVFFSLPDWIAFNGGNGEADLKKMKEVFTPIPYNSKPDLQTENKFVIIYTHKLSDKCMDMNNYRWDGFDIWSQESQTDIAPEIFKVREGQILDSDNASTTQTTAYGYHVPSFGVSVNKQNNTIFKNISVGMSNPMTTEASIVALNNVASLGQAERKYNFIGQDIYNIYSNYSYNVEVDMVGDAQICPLMYFQLSNIPMFRGTYMIFKVSHTLTPGDMNTHFSGMKLSAMPTPWTTRFFNKSSGVGSYSLDGDYSGGVNLDGISLSGNYTHVNSTKDYFWETPYYATLPENKAAEGTKASHPNLNENVIKFFNALCADIDNLPENSDKNGHHWNLHHTNTVRYSSKSSDHYQGTAIDVFITRFNGKTVSEAMTTNNYNGSNQPELWTVVDMICSIKELRNYLGNDGRVLIEFDSETTVRSKEYKKLLMLHLCVKSPNAMRGGISTEIQEITSKTKTYRSINTVISNLEERLNCVPAPYKEIARKFYYQLSLDDFTRFFIDYRGYTKAKLDTYFGSENRGGLASNFSNATIFGMSALLNRNSNLRTDNGAKFLNKLKEVQAQTGISANICMIFAMYETAMKLYTPSNNSHIGMFQWSKDAISETLRNNSDYVAKLSNSLYSNTKDGITANFDNWKTYLSIGDVSSVTYDGALNQLELAKYYIKDGLKKMEKWGISDTNRKNIIVWQNYRVAPALVSSNKNVTNDKSNTYKNSTLEAGLKSKTDLMTNNDYAILRKFGIYV